MAVDQAKYDALNLEYATNTLMNIRMYLATGHANIKVINETIDNVIKHIRETSDINPALTQENQGE